MRDSLLMQRRFGPLFATQFLGAFNDNLFKNALVLLVTFRATTVAGIPPEQMEALSGALFILPFFLLSSLAGDLADKYDKATIIRWVKVAEVGIMGVGAVGFVTGHVVLLLAVLLAMGVHSTVFGPCKYAVLPQHLPPEDLVRGNALVEMGTYLAILLGTLGGGFLVALPGGERWVALGTLAVAALGVVTSRGVPPAPSHAPDLKVHWNPIGPTWRLIGLARENPVIWRSVLAISWFWTFGGIFLSIFPDYTKTVLGGDEGIATLFLALFSVGIGVGSMLCERLSHERVELGLVPLGSFGMSVFALDLWAIGKPWPTPPAPLGVTDLLATPQGVHIAIDLALLAMSGGLLIVPLYALVQLRAKPEEVSRVIAGNNVVNAVFMVVGQLALMGLFAAGLDTLDVLLALFLVNTAVAIHIYTVVPEFLLRFVVWALSFVVYRIDVEGHERIPHEGGVVVVANHVSFVDWLLMAAALRRPARFVMHKDFHKAPLTWLLKQAKAIPIASAKEDPELLETAFRRIHEELVDEQLLCLFPEGGITRTGELMPFRPGIERIVAVDPVPVVPAAIVGMWGSFFSRVEGGHALRKPFRRGLWTRVRIVFGEPVPAAEVTAAGLEAKVRALLGDDA